LGKRVKSSKSSGPSFQFSFADLSLADLQIGKDYCTQLEAGRFGQHRKSILGSLGEMMTTHGFYSNVSFGLQP